MKKQITHFYQDLFDKKLLQLKIQETKATCNQCIMSCERKVRGLTYEEHLKCCTFHPFLPNFMVGAILSDPQISIEQKEILRKKIRDQDMTLPIGVLAPEKYQLQYNKKKKNDFGNREDFLCPYYDKKNDGCGVWQYRGVVCTTFFCESSYGKPGKTFWKYMSDFLSYTEMAMLEEALVHLDFSPRQISDQLEYLQIKKPLEKVPYKKLWNHYEDPEKFYIRCYEYVKSVKKDYFLEAIGEMGQKLQQRVIKKGEQLVK